MHTHRLVTNDGVSEITLSDDDFDRLWLQRQRRIDTPVVVAYGGYTPVNRTTVSTETGGVAYIGYVFEDTSDCPTCPKGLHVTSDTLLHAVALVELVQRQDGNTIDLDDTLALLSSETCTHAAVALYLAGLCVNLAKETGYDLTSLLDHERREAIEEPGGMA